MVVILVCRQSNSYTSASSNRLPPVDINIHISAAHRPYPHAAVSVAVVGPPRHLPEAKDSHWVQDRRPLEERLPVGAAEGLLATLDGKLLEGLVTNLFVVTGAADGSAVQVQTAAVQQGVLGGVMRRQVIEACHQLHLPVLEEAPAISDRHLWQEAFVTNCVRQIQPVSRITCDG
ncbi:hypothetical protein WJX72_000279 [[Myrmecia] bisecta]